MPTIYLKLNEETKIEVPMKATLHSGVLCRALGCWEKIYGSSMMPLSSPSPKAEEGENGEADGWSEMDTTSTIRNTGGGSEQSPCTVAIYNDYNVEQPGSKLRGGVVANESLREVGDGDDGKALPPAGGGLSDVLENQLSSVGSGGNSDDVNGIHRPAAASCSSGSDSVFGAKDETVAFVSDINASLCVCGDFVDKKREEGTDAVMKTLSDESNKNKKEKEGYDGKNSPVLLGGLSSPVQPASDCFDLPLTAEAKFDCSHAQQRQPSPADFTKMAQEPMEFEHGHSGSENITKVDMQLATRVKSPFLNFCGGSEANAITLTTFEEERMSVVSKGPFSGSVKNDENLFSGSFHQRTPCMIGDDEDDPFFFKTSDSYSRDEASISNRVMESAFPASLSNNNNNTSHIVENANLTVSNTSSGHYCVGDSKTGAHQQASATVDAMDSLDRHETDVYGNYSQFAEDGLVPQVYHSFSILEKEIVIEVRNSPASVLNASTDAEKEPLHHGASPSTQHSLCSDSNGKVLSGDVLEEKDVGGASVANVAAPAANLGSAAEGEYKPFLSRALRLCSMYLQHFAADTDTDTRNGDHLQRPTAIPEPLNVPLVSLLSSWELRFLYGDILGESDECVTAAAAILRHAPRMDYINPGRFLSDPAICLALSVGLPTPQSVARLIGVFRVAEALEIRSLQDTCAAWCADVIIRASYAAADCMEAAEFIRRCFHVKSDWTKKEIDCLKLENEWPVDEKE